MKLPLISLGQRQLKKQKPLLAGTDVRELQQMLKRLGFFNSRIDGVFGDETEYCVKKFQKALGMRPNGVADKALFELLEELKGAETERWLTFQKDYRHTGYSPVPVLYDPKSSLTKKIPGIIGFNHYGNILIATSRQGVWALDLKDFSILWKNRDINPVSGASLMDNILIVPTGGLAFIDLYSGKVIKNIDEDGFITPVAANRGAIYASCRGSMFAFDEKGNRLFKYDTEGVFCSPPALAYDLLYFTSYDHHIYCLDSKGNLYWKISTSDIISTAPAVWDSKVFAISRDAWFYALNPLTGDIVWKKKFSDEEFMPPAFCGDLMLAVDMKGAVIALSPQRAEIKWVKELKLVPTTPPLVCPDMVFIGTEEGLAALKIKGKKPTKSLPQASEKAAKNDLLALDEPEILVKFKESSRNKKITAIVQVCFGIAVATEEELIFLDTK